MGALRGIFDPWNSWFWPILRNEDSWLIMKNRALFCARHGAALLSILSHVQNHPTRWGNAPLEKRKQCSQRQMTCLESYSWEVGRVRNWFQVCLPDYHPCTYSLPYHSASWFGGGLRSLRSLLCGIPALTFLVTCYDISFYNCSISLDLQKLPDLAKALLALCSTVQPPLYAITPELP